MNTRIKKRSVARSECPVELYTTCVCSPATSISQGTRDAFSTGSQAQYPPNVRDSYAQAAPIMMPVPRIQHEKSVQGKAVFVQDPYSFFHNPDTAKAKGTMVEANPKNNTGGWI